MVPDKDYYVDAQGNLTTDPSKYARQVGVAGFFLEDHVAKRYGIGGDVMVAADEPGAIRRVAKGAISEPEPDESPAEEPEAAEAADAASPEVEEPKAEAKKTAAKKGAKKK